MRQVSVHKEQLNALRRIAGQVNGVHRMVEKEEYCIDIIIQIYAATHALYKVADNIFVKHMKNCVKGTFLRKSKKEQEVKIDEIITVLKSMRK